MTRGLDRQSGVGDSPERAGQSIGDSVAAILLAEDDEAVREFVRRALAHYGHSVTAVGDGGAALAALEESPYDLLLTDIVMPGMDGIALALKATKDRPALPVVLMTGFAAERQRAHNLDALIDRVVSKPFSLKEICAAVDSALQARGIATAN
jgi:two-component system, cell cycle response regulator CpdR